MGIRETGDKPMISVPRWINRSSVHHLVLLVLVSLFFVFLHGLVTTQYLQYSQFEMLPLESFSEVARGQDTGFSQEGSKDLESQLGYPGFFWSESAFHYRTTLMFAVDGYQDPDILSRDTGQQFPSGVDAWREYSILMEPVLGVLYRWFGVAGQSLVEFLLWVLPLFHAVLLVPIYLLARGLGARRNWALAGALVFATCSLAFSPLLSTLFAKETFSWLLFAVFLVGHFLALNSARWTSVALSTVALFFFLISWHLAQFIFVSVLLATYLGQAWSAQADEGVPKGSGHENQGKLQLSRGQRLPLAYLLAAIAAGFVPWLRERDFFLSLPFLLLLGWFGLSIAQARYPESFRRRRNRGLVYLAVVLASILISSFNSRFIDDYSHVSGLLWFRLINLFQKPWDPSELPFAVRVFWVSPFSTPRLGALTHGIGFNAIPLTMAVIWAGWFSFARSTAVKIRAFGFCLLGFAFAFLFVERLAPVFLLVGAVGVAVSGSWISQRWKSSGIKRLILVGALLFPAMNLAFPQSGQIQISWAAMRGLSPRLSGLDRQWDQARVELFKWIRANTPNPRLLNGGPGAALVAEIGMSPQILLYTGRPTVLNSQFENQEIRHRYEEYLIALFSSEEANLVRFCQKYEASYLLLNRDWAVTSGRNTPKYLSGVSGNLSVKTNVVRLHFDPDGLGYFHPVYENEHYRLFEVGRRSPGQSGPGWERSWAKWWNLENYLVENNALVDASGDRRRLIKLDNLLNSFPVRLKRLAMELEKSWWEGNPGSAPRISLMQLQRELAEITFRIATEGGSLALATRQQELMKETSSRQMERSPNSGLTLHEELLRILNGNSAEGREGILSVLARIQASPEEYSNVGQVLMLMGEFEHAGQMFGKGGSIFPKPAAIDDPLGPRPLEFQEYLWRETVLNLVAGGDLAKARSLARFCANHVAPGSANREFFLQAGKMELQ